MDSNYGQSSEVRDQVLAPVSSTGQWLKWYLLLCIPFVNIILMIVWAVDSKVETLNRRNAMRASLILSAIAFVLGILFSILMVFVMGSMPMDYYPY